MSGTGRATLWESARRLLRSLRAVDDPEDAPKAGRAAVMSLLAALVIWFLLTMGEVHTAVVPFRVVLLNPPPGQALIKPLPAFVEGEVEGQGFDLLELFFDTPPINVRASSETVDLVQEEIDLPSGVRATGFTPRYLSLETDERIERRIPVALRASFVPASTYNFSDSVRYTPDSVLVTGAARVVNGLGAWPTEAPVYSGLRDSLRVRVPLADTLVGYVTVNAEAVAVEVPVAAFTSVERVVEVQIRGAPSNEQVARLTPGEVRVRFNVLLSQYRDALTAQIEAFVRYDDIRRDNTNRLSPTVLLPEFLIYRDKDVIPATVGYYTVQARQ